MSAEVLRRAAASMRERAEAATPGPWIVDVDCPHIVMHPDKPGFSWDGTAVTAIQEDDFGLTDPADAGHIASWHPLVALAVADWLDDTARVWEAFDADPDFVQDEPALAVARAYLADA